MIGRCRVWLIVALLSAGVLWSAGVAAEVALPGIDIEWGEGEEGRGQVANALRIFLVLTVLSLAPGILVMVTSFTRIIVVLSMLRQAFGMPETPPTSVLISLALFLTLFSMMPVLNQINDTAFQPYIQGEIGDADAVANMVAPLRSFMASQTRENDIALMVELSGGERPSSLDDVTTTQLIPAFMISELKTAFQIGFIIFLPFLLIDIIIASILMSMGMLMVPPMMISLPVKVMMFVIIDGWNIVTRSLLGSFL